MISILELNLLGPAEFILDGTPVTGLHSQKAIALLAYLACNPGPQRREFLADLLWDATSTAQSLSNLRTLLSRLRGALGDYLLITPQTIAIAPAVLVDVAALEEQMAAANHLSPDSASHLAQSLSLYRGDFLAGFHLSGAFGFEQWAILERERLRFLILQGYRRLVDYFLEQGEYAAGIHAAAAWLRLNPVEEETHAQMMRLLAGNGQQAAALTHYERCRHLLHTELDVEPSEELQSLYRQISAQKPSSPVPVAAKVPVSPTIPHNLPPRLTSFVGREGEVAAVCDLFAAPATRLVTLVGEGGVGKSSLALAVGEEMLTVWAGGVFLVPLVDVEAHPTPSLPRRLATEVAHAVGLTFSAARGAADPEAQLFSFFRERSLLLILDNFEHLNAGAPFVRDLLQAAPGCRALITARQPLLIQGESVLRLYGLPIPPEAAPPRPQETYASMDLFVQRARQREHGFSLTSANRGALGRLCRLLAGNALALELAAAWVEHFSLAEMTALLEADPLDFLRSPQPHLPERHRSLRRVMETSWGLLSPDARQMLACISIFRGNFHRKAALAVAGGSLDLLVELVNCSLLQQSGPGRYELHELVRQFAGEQLAAWAGAGRQSAESHARYYLGLVGGVDHLAERIAQVTEELANIRQAWDWAVAANEMGALARCSVGLRNFYLRKGLFQEAEEAFGRGIGMILAAPPDAPGRQSALAALQVAQAVFLNIRGNYTAAMRTAEEAVGYAQQGEDKATIARGYLQWGTALYRQGGYADAVTRLTAALAAARSAGLVGDEADILRYLGVTWLEQGDFAAANAYCGQALAIYRDTGNQLGEGNTLNDLGWMHQRQQNFEEARTYLEAAQQIHTAIDNGHGARMALVNLGIVQQMLGNFSQAHSTYLQLLGELDKLPDRYHHSLVNHSLGVLLSRMGDYSTARRHLMLAVEIDRAIGDEGGLAWSYNALGLLHNHLGDYKTGLAFHNEALRISLKQGARTVEGIALLGIGQDLHEMKQWADASVAYEKALAVQNELKQGVRMMESRSGLASALLALDQPEAALAQAEMVMDHLSAHTLRGAAQPARVYWNCYTVLRAQGDPRTANLLESAFNLIQTRAANIQNERLRHAYLHTIPVHRQIAEEVTSLRLTFPFVRVEHQKQV